MIDRIRRSLETIALVAVFGVCSAGVAQVSALDTPAFDWEDPREGQVERMDREQFVETVVRRNLDLEEAKLRAERARLDVIAAQGRQDWQFSSELTATYARTQTNSGISSGRSETLNVDWESTVARQFDTGTTFQLSYRSSIERSEFPLAIEDPETGVRISQRIERGPDFRQQLRATVTQALLRGRGIEANGALELASRERAELETIAIRQQASSLVSEGLQIYAALKYAERELELALSELSRSQTQLEITAAQLNAGRLARYEAGLAEQRVASAQERVLAATLQLRAQSRQVGALMERDPRSELVLAVPYAPQFDSWELDLLCSRIAEVNLEVRTVELQRREASYQQIIAEDEAQHELSVFLTAGAEGFDGSVGGSYASLVTLDSFDLVGGFRFSAAIGRTAARAAAQQASIAMQTLDVIASRIDRGICTQAVTLLDEYEYQAERGRLAEFREARAEEALNAEERRFEGGRATVQQILEAEERLQAVQAEHLQALRRREELLWQIRALLQDYPAPFDELFESAGETAYGQTTWTGGPSDG